MSELVIQLRDRLPAEVLATDPDVMLAYTRDRAEFCEAGLPAAVVLPRTVAQVQEAVRVAYELRVPIVTQGARTGLSGGANASDGCMVLSLVEMDRILEIDTVDRIAVVEAGVVNADLTRAVNKLGLHYPPDPSSWEECTIGGNIATGAGGLCCVKYGVTAEYVLGLDIVLADGRLMSTGRRTAKGVAGYDLTKLFVGSEGSLGIVVQATLGLRPLPPRQLVLAAEFGSADAACDAVCRIMERGHTPALLELMDRVTISAINRVAAMELPKTTEALLLAASDGPDAAADLAAYGLLCTEAGAIAVTCADDAAESEMLLQARRLAHAGMTSMGSILVDDVTVPRSRLADLIAGVAAIADKNQLVVGVSAHAGDGNTHPVIVFDKSDPDESRRAQDAFAAIMFLGLKLGGTITGEHGVGILKKEWLAREIADLGVEMQRKVKHAFDPHGILNPGKLF
ncbi:FAD-binding oxidoreductase [Streptomyces sp. WM6368]|uniref:FAD-binding oxidoreductase n=1 Tax=Streptomyces sp. WM6368 TaxID=1415554 RepID=UPI0006B05308|nr:FAD-linked oxidase C-terminal domain-containing protein [Streptomyces sp. WM6368]KOU25078.1 FAD-linked oxidase [Streptomyces sp. WM6368]